MGKDAKLRLHSTHIHTYTASTIVPPDPITSIAFVGASRIAAGSASGRVALLNASATQLSPLATFQAGPGPVDVLAGVLPAPLARAMALARSPPRAPSDSGRGSGPGASGSGSSSSSSSCDGALVAAASSQGGWLHIYAPELGAHWQLHHSGVHGGSPRVAFSPDGAYLALASGRRGSCTVARQAVDLVVVCRAATAAIAIMCTRSLLRLTAASLAQKDTFLLIRPPSPSCTHLPCCASWFCCLFP